jgi:hypothetical protein
MKNLMMFFLNFLLAVIFGYDMLDYYFVDGIHIINDEVNRVFIMWFGTIVSLLSSMYFLDNHFQNLKNRKL